MPVASDLLISFTRGDALSAIVNVFDARTDALLAVIEDIRAAFELETAVGDRLDRIGGIVQLARESGQTDDAYRLLLLVQIELILSSTGRPGSLMRIVELISGAPPAYYSEFYPRTIEIGAIDDGTLDVDLLLEKLRQAVIGAVRIVVTASAEDVMLLDYTTADAMPDPGLLDYTTADAITGAGTLAYEFPA